MQTKSIKFAAKMTIKVLVDTNPKRKGTVPAARFRLYKKATTVGDYVQACADEGFPRCVAIADLIWDREHGFVGLGAAKARKSKSSSSKAQPAAQ